jgi:GT2 family glycosyltransferase
MTRPWLSVVIPTYNGADYIRETFESLAAQTERGFECVVIDGGSTDATPRIVDEFERHLTIRRFLRPEFPNWVGKTNFGFTVAEAEHVCMLHHDDLWHPERTREVRLAVERHPEAALVLHPVTLIDASSRRVGVWHAPLEPEPRTYAAAELLERLVVQNFVSVSAPTFLRERAIAVGGIDQTLWYTGDWDFYLKLARTGASVYLERPLSSFRLHGASLTMRGSTNVDRFHDQLRLVVNRHVDAIEPASRREAARRLAHVSNEVNVALAAAVHGSLGRLPGAIASFATLGPRGWRRYVRDSRIIERVVSRLQARGLLFAHRGDDSRLSEVTAAAST